MRLGGHREFRLGSDLGQNFLQAIRLLGRALLAQAKPDTVKRCRKPVFLHRLHQIIDRMGIERLQRIIAIGGDEDEQRRFYFHQALDNGKSVETRHLYVEEHEIRSEEHTSEIQSLMRSSYAVFCLKKKKKTSTQNTT